MRHLPHRTATTSVTGRAHAARRSLALAATAALVLAGCGDADDDLAVDDAAEAEDDDEAPVEDDEDTGEDAGDDDDGSAGDDDEAGGDDGATDDSDAGDTDADDEGGEDADEDEDAPTTVGEHRPSEDIDCSGIDESSVGAIILFPDSSTTDAGPGPVAVEVAGCSDTFEANVQYEAFHGNDTEPTLNGFTMGGTLGDWAEFSFTETYWTPGEWTVVVFDDDAESGERIEFDEVTFTVG